MRPAVTLQHPRPRQGRRAVAITAVAAATAALTAAGVVAAHLASAAPETVTVGGSFNSEIGCAADWSAGCTQAAMTLRADGVWSATIQVPAGSWAYKAAIDGGWGENYGAHAAAGGADIPLTVPAGGRAVTFVYHPASHWITDDVAAPLVTAAGSFQSELGCAADWAPDCLRSWLQDADGDGVATFSTTAIPAGSWEVKVAAGMSWAVNYGQGGAAGGANIAFTVPAAGAATTFSYQSGSHLLRVQSGAAASPTPSGSGGTPATLGAIYTAAATTFRLWSPESAAVSVTVGGTSYPMTPATVAGYTDVYQAVVAGDLRDRSYQFTVAGTAVRDPYARMVVPGTTQGVVVDVAAVAPSRGSWAPTPALANREDSVVYELSVRDFTVDASSGVDAARRGRFLGLVQTGTTYQGVRTGIDHLKELGVTTVQIMPAFDFATTVPNWGYDPLNFNVPEEQYSQFTAPVERIREFKDMVDGFHANGIRVVLDVVYNHTASRDVLAPITGRYYTATDYSGCCGNSLDDSQPMVSRMIRDSLEHWVRDYHVDGFRFDLLGIFHHSQVAAWGSYLDATYPGRNLLLYGEPWMGGVTPSGEADFVRYGSTASMAAGHVGVFNGAVRDAVRGGTRDTVLGFMGGGANAAAVATGARGSPLAVKGTWVLANLWDPAFAYDPEQTVNYVSVHDDLNLYDKITYSGVAGGGAGRAGQMDRFAAGVVLTSQGVPLIAEGDEFLRSKVVGGDYQTAMNSYNASDAVNAIHWADKVTNAATVGWYRAAIALRRATPALRLTTWDAVRAQQVTQVAGAVVVSTVSGNAATPTSYDTVVVLNPTSAATTVTLPAGAWTKVLDTGGSVSSTDTSCAALTVTVFRR